MKPPTLVLGALALLATTASAHFTENLVYVLDHQASKVYVVLLGAEPYYQETMQSPYAELPGGIGFTFDAEMLLVNYANDAVYYFDADGGPPAVVLTAADGITGVRGPSAIGLSPLGEIYFCDSDASRLIRYNADFTNMTVIADAADGLVDPTAVAVLADGNLLVTDRAVNTVFHVERATGNTAVFEDFGPATPLDVVVRDNTDLYLLTDGGELYRYPGAAAGSGVLLGCYGSGEGSLSFSHDQATLYHVNEGDQNLRLIDPDTGADFVQFNFPFSPSVVDCVGSRYAHGNYYEFGDPLPGTGGVPPRIDGIGEPRIDQQSAIEVHDVLGGAPVFLAFSSAGFFAPTPFLGGDLHLDLSAPGDVFPAVASGVPGVAGDGETALDVLIPDNPALAGAVFWWQAATADAGAPAGISLTDCLRMYVGL